MKTTTKVELIYRGVIVSESETKDIDHRDPHRVEVPRGAYAFRFFDLETQVATLEDGSTFEHHKRVNESPTYYPGGVAMTAADIEAMDGDHRILLSNMRRNGYAKVIRTRRGNYQPFENGKTVLV